MTSVNHERLSIDSWSATVRKVELVDRIYLQPLKMEGNQLEEDLDILRDSCAVFGCIAGKGANQETSINNIIYLSLMALQHRGQESSGMVVYNGQDFLVKKGMGLVSNVYQNGSDTFKSSNELMGIGHNRYSTEGKSELTNCQPFVVDTIHGKIAVAHNGEIVNSKSLRKRILRHGIGLSTGSDSELITQLMVSEPPEGEPDGPNWPARIRNLMSIVKCSYSLLIMTSDGIYGVRDPFGNRPLCIGEIAMPVTQSTNGLHNGESDIKRAKFDPAVYVISSESCAFHSIGAKLIRDVQPGEIVHLSSNGFKSLGIIPRNNGRNNPAFCIFEYVYFARADSVMEGQSIYQVRKECGRQLAIESHVDADIVSTVPESATPAAFGYSMQSNIPYCEVLVKNRYVGRTFIQPSTRLRKLGVTTKFGPIVENFKGKRIVILDDSIVRGNTMGPIVKLLKLAGAKEVHIRVASPPLKYACFMGINIPTREELIANKLDPVQLAQHLDADSVAYLSLDGLKKSVQKGITNVPKIDIGHCTACLTGEYPVELEW